MAILILGDFYYGYDYIPEEIKNLSKFIKDNDFSVILNLEGAITEENNKICKRGEHLRQSSKVIEVLKLLNVKGVTLANNHIYDFGEKGLVDTIKILQKNGIQCSGAGLTETEAYKPIEITDNGKTYHFYSMTDSYEEAICIDSALKTSGCANIDYNVTKRFNQGVKSYVILHTGFEYNTLPMPRNIKQCKEFVNLGAEGVICMHPHVVQPNVKYKNKNISFSLGNFYFSNFREEFSRKFINYKSKGFCNVGYGVVLGELENQYISVKYFPNKKITEFMEDKICVAELKDKNNCSLKYIFQCLKCRNNYNPILLGINWIDSILIGMLNIAYYVYGILRKNRG